MGPLKICHTITRMIVGGAQENTLLSALGHLENGHQSMLLTGPTTGPEGQLLERARDNSVEEIKRLRNRLEIVETPTLVREIDPLQDYRAFKKLREFYRSRDFDVVHTHSSKAGVVARAAAWSARVPVVVHTVHGQAFHRFQSPWRNELYIRAERFAARRCHRIFAVAQATLDQCVEARVAPADKYAVVHSGMDLQPYLSLKRDQQLADRLGIPPGSLVIGKIARIFELKGYEFLVPIARRVLDHVPNAHFLIVGDGLLRKSVEREVEASGLAQKFTFAGLVDPTEIPRHLSLMDCLLHLSLREGLPRVAIQAHAGAKPAVAYDVDGTPEIIEHGATGFVCPPKSIEEPADGLIRILNDDQLRTRFGEAGREKACRHWDWRDMVRKLESEYTLLRQASPSTHDLPSVA